MSDQSATESGERTDPHQLVEAISLYQHAYHHWQNIPDGPDREVQRVEVRRAVEQLWPLLRQVLRSVAYEWVPRQQMQSVEIISRNEAIEEVLTNLCLEAIDHLPHLTINPDDNPIGLLRTIARRHEIDAYRRYTRRYLMPETAPETADEPPARRTYQMVTDEEVLHRCADECLRHFAEFVIAQEDARTAVASVLAYWQSTLSAEELFILYARLIHEPPIPHADLAERFGSAWSSELVRMRYHRLLRRTQEFLRSSGLAE